MEKGTPFHKLPDKIPRDAIANFVQTASTFGNMGIIHGDISPQNIALMENE